MGETEPLHHPVEKNIGENKENTERKLEHLIQLTTACSARDQHAEHVKYTARQPAPTTATEAILAVYSKETLHQSVHRMHIATAHPLAQNA